MTTETGRKRVAPYVPASTLSQFFDHIRYVREPTEVDAGLLQDYGTKQGQVFALLSTLKYLGLTDNKGKPTPVFRELQTGGDEFKSALRGVLERAYSDVFARLDVSRDTKDKIVNFFARNHSPATAERAARLFLDLCGEAGIETASQPRQSEARTQAKVPVVGTKRQAGEQPKRQGGEAPKLPKDINREDESSDAPRIDIRINSQDLVNMQPDQIKAVFEGLARLAPRGKNGKARERPSINE